MQFNFELLGYPVSCKNALPIPFAVLAFLSSSVDERILPHCRYSETMYGPGNNSPKASEYRKSNLRVKRGLLMKQAIRLFALALILLPIAALAQVGTATLLGTVSDTSGSPIAGASVVIWNTATGTTHQFGTGGSGNFDFPYVAQGTYQVTAEKASFQTKVVDDFSVQVEQRARLDLTLAPGQVTQQVRVTASGPAISTDSATVGHVINNQQVVALPLNGRNWISLAFVAPGVISADTAGTNADFSSPRAAQFP
jgi:hypothetical protein